MVDYEKKYYQKGKGGELVAVLHRRRGDRASTSGLALVVTLSRLAQSEKGHDDPLVRRPVRTCTVDAQHQII